MAEIDKLITRYFVFDLAFIIYYHMHMYNMKKTCFLCIIIVFYVVDVYSFFNKSNDARLISLAGAYEASINSSRAIFYNPASISDILKKEVSFSLATTESLQKYNATFGYPVKYGAIAAGVSYFGDKASYSDDFSNFVAVIGWGYPIYSEMRFFRRRQIASVGASLKLINNNLAGKSKAVIAADIGTNFKLSNSGWRFAAVVNDLGSEYKIEGTRIKLPTVLDLNLSKRNFIDDVNLALSYGSFLNAKDLTYFGIGTELMLSNSLRLGFGVFNYKDESRMTGGLGVRTEDLTFDYGIVFPKDKYDPINTVSFAIRFGDPKEDPGNLERMYQKGKRYYFQGNLIKAKDVFERILKMAKKYKETKEYLSQIRKTLRQIKRGKPILEKESEQVNTMMIVGDNFFNKGEYQQAIKYYIAVTVVERNNMEAVYKIQQSRQKMLEMNKRRALLLEKNQTEQSDKIILKYFNQGLDFYDDKNYWSALSKYNEGFKLSKKTAAKNWKDKFQKEIHKTKNKIAVRYYEKGYRYYQQNDLGKSAAEFQKALNYNPAYESAKEKLTDVKKRLLQINEKKAKDLYEHGMTQYTKGNIQEAIKLWEKVLTYDDDHIAATRALERAKIQR